MENDRQSIDMFAKLFGTMARLVHEKYDEEELPFDEREELLVAATAFLRELDDNRVYAVVANELIDLLNHGAFRIDDDTVLTFPEDGRKMGQVAYILATINDESFSDKLDPELYEAVCGLAELGYDEPDQAMDDLCHSLLGCNEPDFSIKDIHGEVKLLIQGKEEEA